MKLGQNICRNHQQDDLDIDRPYTSRHNMSLGNKIGSWSEGRKEMKRTWTTIDWRNERIRKEKSSGARGSPRADGPRALLLTLSRARKVMTALLIAVSEARSRLDQSRFSRPDTHFAAVFKIYKNIIFLQANLQRVAKVFQNFAKILENFGKLTQNLWTL